MEKVRVGGQRQAAPNGDHPARLKFEAGNFSVLAFLVLKHGQPRLFLLAVAGGDTELL